ncbi:hypothetical protein VNO80_33800 [Phaseolus coccineus]|uniref:Uncharacterized protein n=1 Tax=Phaseolus coccineus TaxID=3886 RepID=A0AAN9Q5R6_PHACN
MISRPFSTLAISSQSPPCKALALARWKEERVSRDGTTRRQDQIKELHSKLGKIGFDSHSPAAFLRKKKNVRTIKCIPLVVRIKQVPCRWIVV